MKVSLLDNKPAMQSCEYTLNTHFVIDIHFLFQNITYSL